MFDTEDFSIWDQAEQLATKAYELYEDGRMSDALEQLSQAIHINPANSAWYFNAGLTLDALERFDEAVESYLHALEIGGDDPEILNSLAVDYTRTGQYDLAIAAFEKIEQLDPEFEPCYCNRIITYTEMDKHEQAEQMFYLAQQLNPDCPICFYNIGNSLFTQGNFKKAVWCWKKTAQLEPTHPQINFRIAQALWADGQMLDAKQYFLKELRCNPGDTDVILDFGIFLLKTGQSPAAKEKFNRLIELNPDCAQAFFYLGELALAENLAEEAKELFLKALRKDANFTGPRYRLAQIAMARNERQIAKSLLDEEMNLEVDEPDVLVAMGTMLTELGDIDKATDCLLKAIDEDNTNAKAFRYLGITLGKRAEYEGAIQVLEHAVSLGADDAEVIADTAWMYYRTGHLTRAEELITKAKLLLPADAAIHSLACRIRLAAAANDLRNAFASSRLWQKIKYAAHRLLKN